MRGAYDQIDTIYGPLTVSAEGVSCVGPGCPDLLGFVAEARIAGAATVATGLLPDLLEGFAVRQGMTLVADAHGRGEPLTRRVRVLALDALVPVVSPDPPSPPCRWPILRGSIPARSTAAGAARVDLRVTAFGEALPMACEDTEWGRAVNRRVEVWVE